MNVPSSHAPVVGTPVAPSMVAAAGPGAGGGATADVGAELLGQANGTDVGSSQGHGARAEAAPVPTAISMPTAAGSVPTTAKRRASGQGAWLRMEWNGTESKIKRLS